MPLRRRHPILAGVAALVGLSITGCVADQVHTAGPLPAPSPAPAVSMAAPQPIQQVQAIDPPPAAAAPVISTIEAPTTPLAAPRPSAQVGRPARKPLFGGGSGQTSGNGQAPAHVAASPLVPAHAPAASPAAFRHEVPEWGVAHRTASAGGPAAPQKPHIVGYIPSKSNGAPMPMPVGPVLTSDGDDKREGELKAPREDRSAAATSSPRSPIFADGPSGKVHPVDAPREFAKRALSAYIVEPPDVLAIELAPYLNEGAMPIIGPHLVRPDGSVGLGAIGSVFVAGMTLADAKERIAQAIFSQRRAGPPDKDKEKEGRKPPTLDDIRAGLKVDVQAYNSKFYYVVTDGGGYGAQVFKVPCTGNELVLDAIAQIQGLPAVSSPKKIWIARATPHGGHPNILPVDFHGIVMAGSGATNYQLFPGDRLFVHSDPRIRTDSHVAKILAPIERILGVTLLGASTVNTIRFNNNNLFNNRGF
jgi:polysaccharide export outer membrane protein